MWIDYTCIYCDIEYRMYEGYPHMNFTRQNDENRNTRVRIGHGSSLKEMETSIVRAPP